MLNVCCPDLQVTPLTNLWSYFMNANYHLYCTIRRFAWIVPKRCRFIFSYFLLNWHKQHHSQIPVVAFQYPNMASGIFHDVSWQMSSNFSGKGTYFFLHFHPTSHVTQRCQSPGAKTTFHLLLSDCGAEGRGSPQDVTPSILVKLHRDLTWVFIPNGGLVWEIPLFHGNGCFQKLGYPKMDGL